MQTGQSTSRPMEELIKQWLWEPLHTGPQAQRVFASTARLSMASASLGD